MQRALCALLHELQTDLSGTHKQCLTNNEHQHLQCNTRRAADLVGAQWPVLKCGRPSAGNGAQLADNRDVGERADCKATVR
jgi:hypothetical protein